MRRTSNLLQRPPGTTAAPVQDEIPTNYLALYGLSKAPFGTPADSDGYILFDSHRRVFEALLDHMINGSGLLVLRGDDGAGKSQMLAAAGGLAADRALRVIQPPAPDLGKLNLPQLLTAILGTGDAPMSAEANLPQAIQLLLTPPRAVLLIDDLSRLTAECVPALVTILQRPEPPAIVLTATTDPQNNAGQTTLAPLATKELVIPRLGPAEIRQYIERSLWIAGGTTRRLIAPEAMRLIVASSKGRPGSINRLMETILTAGFARGDSLITAKTVAATLTPYTTHRRTERPERSGRLATIAPVIGLTLLFLGAAVFVYRGVIVGPGIPEQPKPSPSAATHGTIPPAVPQTSPSPELLAALLKLGDQALSRGDVAAARLVYQRTADAGSAPAATALGKTYDPSFQTSGADSALASQWYRKAISQGDQQAADLLNRLLARSVAPKR